METVSEIGIYKILRKVGVRRTALSPNTRLRTDLFFDDYDWNCFLFHMETKMQYSLSENEVRRMNTVNDAIQILGAHQN
jgi:hypothetical protein